MYMKQKEELKQLIANRDRLIDKLQKENATFQERQKFSCKILCGSKKSESIGKKSAPRSREIVKGHRDYENLLPMIIGINTNNIKHEFTF